MRLIWTGNQPVLEDRRVLAERGFDPARMGLGEGDPCRIKHRFPVLISRSGALIEEAFRFLFDVAFVRGSTTSLRTLETYAESLISWLSYTEDRGLQWRRPTAVMLASYRDHMLGTDGEDRHHRPLSRRTVNLRLTVAIEFYKHLGCVTPRLSSRPVSARFGEHRTGNAGVSDVGPHPGRNQDFRHLRVRIYSRRPKALHVEQCRALSEELRNPYRLMWQWALCTGLRTSSLVRIELKAFSALTEHSRWGQTIEVPAKGGKIVGVHVPTELIVATARYVAVDRVLVAGRRDRPPEAALFLNARGQSVTGKSFYRALRRASARSGVSARPHQARTTFATYVRDKLEAMTCAGANLDAVKVVQSLLAHADARTTEQYLESIDVPSLDVLQALDDLARTAVWDQDGP